MQYVKIIIKIKLMYYIYFVICRIYLWEVRGEMASKYYLSKLYSEKDDFSTLWKWIFLITAKAFRCLKLCVF